MWMQCWPHMKEFCGQVNQGKWKGFTGKAITDVVVLVLVALTLGLSWSEALKPSMWAQVFTFLHSNIDGTHVLRC